MLHAISVQGFKSIKELKDFELRNLNLFIGANGSGKSNFISLFKMLNQTVERKLQAYVGMMGGADNLLHFGQKTTDQMKVELRFGSNGYRCVLVPAEADTLVYEEECSLFYGEGYREPHITPMGSGHKETNIYDVAEQKKVAEYVLSGMKGWRVYHFHDTSESAKVKKMCDINDNAYLKPDASNLAAYLYLLKQKHGGNYNSIVDTIRMAAPFFDDFQLRPSPLNENNVQLEWKHRNSDAHFGAGALSDGTLRFMCLATLLLQPKDNLPKTILLDEPELGLHPYAITLLASMLRSAAVETQVLVSTQSVTLVNQFKPEDIVVVDRNNGESVFRRLAESEIQTWLDEYGMGDLWEKNLVGGRP